MSTYRRRQHTLDAIKLTHPMTIRTDTETLTGEVGDWLCSDGRQQWFMTDAAFRAEYESYTPYTYGWWGGTLLNPQPQWWNPTVTYNTAASSGALAIPSIIGLGTTINPEA